MTDSSEECGLTAALKAMTGKWKPDVLCELGKAPRRFGRLRQSIPAVSEKMLAQTLRELEDHGLVDRTVHDNVTPKVVYSLTARGVALNRAAAAFCDWHDRFPEREAGHAVQPDERASV